MTSVVPQELYKETGLAPVMAIPSRRSESSATPSYRRTFFVTSKTTMGQRLLQSDRAAALLVDVLRSHMAAGRFVIHDFVVMPDHFHALISVGPEMTIEKTMQFIKGGFSYRMRKELGYPGEVWQRGFSEVSVAGEESLRKHREYIAQNPLRAGVVREGEEFTWCFETLKKRKAAVAKASSLGPLLGTTEQPPE
jgi:putative transposase